jgi:hypothetical protein
MLGLLGPFRSGGRTGALAALTTGFSPAEDGVGVSVSLMVEAR